MELTQQELRSLRHLNHLEALRWRERIRQLDADTRDWGGYYEQRAAFHDGIARKLQAQIIEENGEI